MDPFNILYSQNSIDSTFRSHEDVPYQWRGRPLTEAIQEAQNLRRLPDGLVINAIRGGDGQWITLNNRTLFVAQEAGLHNVNPVDAGAKGMNKMLKLLKDSGLIAPVAIVTVRE